MVEWINNFFGKLNERRRNKEAKLKASTEKEINQQLMPNLKIQWEGEVLVSPYELVAKCFRVNSIDTYVDNESGIFTSTVTAEFINSPVYEIVAPAPQKSVEVKPTIKEVVDPIKNRWEIIDIRRD